MQVSFWGTRGSIAKAGPTTIRYGGNTSCVSVRYDAGTQIVIDCGTGAHGLGQALTAAAGGRRPRGVRNPAFRNDPGSVARGASRKADQRLQPRRWRLR